MNRKQEMVLAGYEVGTGARVEIPLAHTFVTGQTQRSGKTTTLRAIVERSGRRALAFVTKRGEEFAGMRIRPFLPREGDRPIHWRLVETILASALGQRSMKYERYWIVNAAKGARSLADVRRNVDRLRQKAKGSTAETYELIGEYLDLVLPEMRELNAADELALGTGLNVIDIAGHSQQLQAMVIRACLEQINQHESGVLTVFPEAWEFAPRGRVTPASSEAVAMARKGAVLGNFLLCDSQDIAGVDTQLRQAASVWLFGVQRELNELKRTLAMIPAGIRKPKPAEITSLEVGQFICCFGSRAVRTYIQPAWMNDSDARAIAMGAKTMGELVIPADVPREQTAPPPAIEPAPAADESELEDDMSKEDIDQMKQQIGELVKVLKAAPPHAAPSGAAPAHDKSHAGNGSIDREELFEWIKGRLQEEAPRLLNVSAEVPELRVTEEIKTIEASTTGKGALMGRLAMLIAEGFFDEARSDQEIRDELKRHGLVAQKTYANVTYATNRADLVKWGFLFIEGDRFKANPRMKKQIQRIDEGKRASK